jgi:hypothetical protein
VKLQFDTTQKAKIVSCGLLWESYDPNYAEIDHALCDMPWPSPPHLHPFSVEQYQFTAGGTAKLHVAGVSQMARPGHIEVIRPGEVHYTIPHPERIAASPVRIMLGNVPAFNSFDPPDFVVPGPDHMVWQQWREDLCTEFRRRLGVSWLAPKKSLGSRDPEQLSWMEVAELLCLPGYEKQFAKSGIKAVE